MGVKTRKRGVSISGVWLILFFFSLFSLSAPGAGAAGRDRSACGFPEAADGISEAACGFPEAADGISEAADGISEAAERFPGAAGGGMRGRRGLLEGVEAE